MASLNEKIFQRQTAGFYPQSSKRENSPARDIRLTHLDNIFDFLILLFEEWIACL